MKRNIFLGLLILLLLLGASACSGEGAAGGGTPDAGGTASEAGGPDSEESADPALLRLEMTQASYPLSAEKLDYQIINETDGVRAVSAIPLLERLEDGEWIPMECSAGFCGTPDFLDAKETWESSISPEWYPDLSTGDYRLTLSVVDETNYEKTGTISAEFTLT